MASQDPFYSRLFDNVISVESMVSQEESQEIKTDVITMVQCLVTEIGNIDPEYNIKGDVMLVGSTAEGTKICKPDEFDFLVQLEEYSSGKYVTLSNSCKQTIGSVQVSVKRDAAIRSGIHVKTIVQPRKVRANFHHLTSQAMFKHSNKKLPKKHFGQLELANVENRGLGPNTNVFMRWLRENDPDDYILIGVDITPYIPCTEEMLEELKHHIDPIEYKKISMYPVLVPPSISAATSCGEFPCCWRVSFTPLEVESMKQLHPCHRQCYQLLKFFCKGIFNKEEGGLYEDAYRSYNLKTLSSYILKNTLLHHNRQCKRIPNISECKEDVISFLESCRDKKFLPNYFMPTRNTWPLSKNSGRYIVPPPLLLTKLRKLFHETEQMTQDEQCSFDDILKRVNRFRILSVKLEKNELHKDDYDESTIWKRITAGEERKPLLCLPTPSDVDGR